MFRRTAVGFLALLAFPLAALAQQPAAGEKPPKPHMTEVMAASLKWAPLDVPGFVPGIQVAAISGDPEKAEPYTIRLRFPDGYAFPAHWHPNWEHLTVLSGTFLLAMGEKTDKSALKKYGVGDFLHLPPKQPHFGSVEGETVVQLHGTGPFGITVTEEIPGAAKAK